MPALAHAFLKSQFKKKERQTLKYKIQPSNRWQIFTEYLTATRPRSAFLFYLESFVYLSSIEENTVDIPVKVTKAAINSL